ncbi:MAG: lipase, partial [Acidimicrobiales bacterium]
MTRPRLVAALCGPLALLAAACPGGAASPIAGSSSTSSSSSVPKSASPVEVPATGDLYALAAPLASGQPGDVIAVQEVDGVDVAATVLRVLYHSQSIAGADIAVSGLIVVPKGAAPKGGRTMLSWAHGTAGIADQC